MSDEGMIEELIEKSSLGTATAQALRAKTTDDEVSDIRRLLEGRATAYSIGSRESRPTRHIDGVTDNAKEGSSE